MAKGFAYNGEWFTPFRKMTKAEREQPLDAVQDKMIRYSNEEFEKYWDLIDFEYASQTDADLFWWNGKLVIPSWDTIYILNGWL